MKDKLNYVRNRIVSGRAPHKLLEKAYDEYKKNQKKDVFSIEKVDWKDLKK